MNIVSTIILFVLWIIFVFGLLATTFTNFQYLDLNILMGIALFFAGANTFFKLSKKTKVK